MPELANSRLSQSPQIDQSKTAEQAQIPSQELNIAAVKKLAEVKAVYRAIQKAGGKALIVLEGKMMGNGRDLGNDSLGVAVVTPSSREGSNNASSERPTQQLVDSLAAANPSKALFSLHPVSKVLFTPRGSEVSLNGSPHSIRTIEPMAA